MSVERDPYFSAQAIEGKSDLISERIGSLMGGWIVVFCLNLIVPLMIALSLGGKVGMILAILVLLAAGCFVVARHRRFGQALVIGGLFVAVSQFFPVLQFGVGFLGLMAARFVDDVLPERDRVFGISELDGFIATIVTGSLLITVAMVLGLLERGMSSSRSKGMGKAGMAESKQR